MKCVGLVVGLLVVGSLFGKEASFGDFDARAKAGERLTVAFFGGSLTWSANATEPNVTGFRGLMAKDLSGAEKRHPRLVPYRKLVEAYGTGVGDGADGEARLPGASHRLAAVRDRAHADADARADRGGERKHRG